MKSKYYCLSCDVTGGIEKLLNHSKHGHSFTNKNPITKLNKGDANE